MRRFALIVFFALLAIVGAILWLGLLPQITHNDLAEQVAFGFPLTMIGLAGAGFFFLAD